MNKKTYAPNSNHIRASYTVKPFTPRNTKQLLYASLLRDPQKDIVVATGPAGCAKTYISTLVGVESLIEGKFKRLVITRPAVAVEDEQHGFLPGTLNEKMKPWMMPIFDVFQMYFDKVTIEKMIYDDKIVISSLAHMRGMTFRDSFIMLDEAQNCTRRQMLMALTRIGDNSKMVVTGDPNQHDRGDAQLNGLSDLINRLDNLNELIACGTNAASDKIAHISFGNEDVERHAIIPIILDMYDD